MRKPTDRKDIFLQNFVLWIAKKAYINFISSYEVKFNVAILKQRRKEGFKEKYSQIS